MARYIALIDGKAGEYGLVIPDLPGCTAMGATVEEVMLNAVAAARDWATDAKTSGEALPKPRSAQDLMKDRDVTDALSSGGFLVVIPVVVDLGRSTRANISLDTGLLDAIDEAAGVAGLTRSAFIASAALEKIAKGA